MLRIFSDLCHFPRCSRHILSWLVVPVAVASGAVAGCNTASGQLAGASSPDLASEVAAKYVSTNISRMQKPENPAPKAKGAPAILDQVSYEVSTQGDVAARIRATVNGIPILDEEVREAIYPYLVATQTLPEPERSNKRKEIFEAELKQLIEREVILQDMLARLHDRTQVLEKLKQAADKEFDKKMKDLRKRASIKNDEEFKAFLRAQGLTLAGVRRQNERQFMALEYMRNRIVSKLDSITPEQVQDYYKQHPEQFQITDSVTWQDIFIDASRLPSRDAAKQLAGKVLEKARAGEDFLKLVAAHDNGESSYRNGEGYGHHKGEIKPIEAEAILFKMKDGEVGPLIEQQNGFHIIRLVKREYAGLKPFDEKTQTSIKNKLQSEVWEIEYKRILVELKRKAVIQVSTGAQ